MTKLVIANWKSNPKTLTQAVKLAKACDKKGVVIAPPFVFLEEVGKVLKKATLGAQDVSFELSGAHTGDTSVKQLKSLGVKYVIVGHSERRALGETDAVINKKIKAVLAGGLKAVLCVGEKKRELGIKNRELNGAKNYIKNQLEKDLAGIQNSIRQPADKIQNSLAIAYEPVWAIGTGKNETPENTSEMAGFIKKLIVNSLKLKVRILYGGSVNSKNAKSFLKSKNIDGLLVGGASLKAGEFGKIINW